LRSYESEPPYIIFREHVENTLLTVARPQFRHRVCHCSSMEGAAFYFVFGFASRDGGGDAWTGNPVVVEKVNAETVSTLGYWQSPVDFGSTPLTARVRLRLCGNLHICCCSNAWTGNLMVSHVFSEPGLHDLNTYTSQLTHRAPESPASNTHSG